MTATEPDCAGRFQRVTRVFGGRTVLRDVSWTIPAGRWSAVLGPNGCGKSTLLRLLTGYLFPTTGVVHLLGHRLGRVDLPKLRRRIGVVDPEGPVRFPPTMTVRDAVVTGFFGHHVLHFDDPTADQRERADALLPQVGLTAVADKPVATLSSGERRRLLLARAAVAEPDLLVLDEPTTGLDLPGRENLLAGVLQLTRSRPTMSVLSVTHHLEELPEPLAEVLLLRDGSTVSSGSPDAVLTAANLSDAFGLPVSVRRDGGRWHWALAR